MATRRKKASVTKSKSSAAAKKTKTKNADLLSPEQDIEAYSEMLMIRRFEEKAGQMYGMGLIGGLSLAWPWRLRMGISLSPRIAIMVICWRWAWIPKA